MLEEKLKFGGIYIIPIGKEGIVRGIYVGRYRQIGRYGMHVFVARDNGLIAYYIGDIKRVEDNIISTHPNTHFARSDKSTRAERAYADELLRKRGL